MASLTCAFRYGREDLDVLGLTFRKELHQGTLIVKFVERDNSYYETWFWQFGLTEKQQVYPPLEENNDKELGLYFIIKSINIF